MKNPFKAFESFNKEDTGLFFGRDAELHSIVNQLKNSSTIILYGPLGCGKSSIVRCGFYKVLVPHQTSIVILRLDQNSFKVANIQDFDNKYASCTNLSEFCEIYYKDLTYEFSTTYFIFDQFEEVFIENKQETKCINEIIDVYNWDGQKKIIFSIREEWLGHMDSLENHFPDLLNYRLRIKNASRNNVRDFLTNTLDLAGITLKTNVEDGAPMIEKLIDKLRMKNGDFLLPYIQLSLYQFWIKDKNRDELQNLPQDERWIWELDEIEQDINLETAVLDYLRKSIHEISNEMQILADDIWVFIQRFQKKGGLRKSEFLSNCQGYEEILHHLKEKSIVHIKNDNLKDPEYEFTHDIMSKVVYTQENFRKKSDLINAVESRYDEYIKSAKDKSFLLSEKRIKQLDEFSIRFQDVSHLNYIQESSRINKQRKIFRKSLFYASIIIPFLLASYFVYKKDKSLRDKANTLYYDNARKDLNSKIAKFTGKEIQLSNFLLSNLKTVDVDPTLVEGIINLAHKQFNILAEKRSTLAYEVKHFNLSYKASIEKSGNAALTFNEKNQLLAKVFQQLRYANSRNLKNPLKYYADVILKQVKDINQLQIYGNEFYLLDKRDSIYNLPQQEFTNANIPDTVELQSIYKGRYHRNTPIFLKNNYSKKGKFHQVNYKRISEHYKYLSHIKQVDSIFWFQPQFEYDLICQVDMNTMNSQHTNELLHLEIDSFFIENNQPIVQLDVINSSSFVITDNMNTVKVYDKDSLNAFKLSAQISASNKITLQYLVPSYQDNSRILVIGYANGSLELYKLQENSFRKKFTLSANLSNISSVIFFNNQQNLIVAGEDENKLTHLRFFDLKSFSHDINYTKKMDLRLPIMDSDENNSHIVRLFKSTQNKISVVDIKNGNSEVLEYKKDPTSISIYEDKIYFTPKGEDFLYSLNLSFSKKFEKTKSPMPSGARITALEMISDTEHLTGLRSGEIFHVNDTIVSITSPKDLVEVSAISFSEIDSTILWGNVNGHLYSQKLNSSSTKTSIYKFNYKIIDIKRFSDDKNLFFVSTEDGRVNLINLYESSSTVFIENNENIHNLLVDASQKKLITVGVKETSEYNFGFDNEGNKLFIDQDYEKMISHKNLEKRVQQRFRESEKFTE